MYNVETIKGTLGKLTGLGRPTVRHANELINPRKPLVTKLKDDGAIPNNPTLPFIQYRGAVSLTEHGDPAAIFEQLFETNGWVGSWRNGIYDFVHYHPRTHEVLGIAHGHAIVRFGGKRGKSVKLKGGDVVILPAGTGHQALSASKDLLVVGAYPVSGKYDEYKGSLQEHERAVVMIRKVRLPAKDPIYGRGGPLKKLWHK
jgi:uncharacterized protein YjlB